MLKKNPEGYKALLVYKKADELHVLSLELAKEIKGVRGEDGERNKILTELADQIGRAARSPKSNIVEGWKRNTSKEYFGYLGFSIGSVEEIREDVSDIIKGKYKELMGVRGIMGERVVKDERAIPFPLNPSTLLHPLTLDQVEKLPFYPLNPLLPLVVQVYLRCKELSFLFYKLQQSLDVKMAQSGELPLQEKLKNRQQQEQEAEMWLKGELAKLKGEKRDKGE